MDGTTAGTGDAPDPLVWKHRSVNPQVDTANLGPYEYRVDVNYYYEGSICTVRLMVLAKVGEHRYFMLDQQRIPNPQFDNIQAVVKSMKQTALTKHAEAML